MIDISVSYVGFSKEILSPEEVLRFFDSLWGEDSRKLPAFPEVIGKISASWHSVDGKLHQVAHINELIEAYKKEITYDINIGGSINNRPRLLFNYIPAHKKATCVITAKTEEIADQYLSKVKDVFPIQEIPIVFISYTAEELALADFIRDVVNRLTESKIEAFVAKRDIPAGDNPLKTMMEEKLKHAKAIIPICSVKSKMSSWVWWESAAVWAKDRKVYPLFTNISAGDFGAPLTLVSQGKDYFVRSEFIETVKIVCADAGVSIVDGDLTEEEWNEYEKLKSEYSKPETSAKISVDFKKLEMTQDLHKYSFVFEIENRSQKRFKDVDVELYFPVDYLEEKKWDYPHLRSSTSHNMQGYLCVTFSFAGLPETAKKQFISSLLPGKNLKVFGEDGMTKLHYYMDHDRWDKRFKYDVQWKVYINGGAPQEGSIPLNSIQFF